MYGTAAGDTDPRTAAGPSSTQQNGAKNPAQPGRYPLPGSVQEGTGLYPLPRTVQEGTNMYPLPGTTNGVGGAIAMK